MCDEEFKKEVKALQKQFKANVKDKDLYEIIEQIVEADPDMKKWIEEE